MVILIQSLAWALVCSVLQGFVVYSFLWLVLKVTGILSPRVKYHLSLSALIVLLLFFVNTWWQQLQLLLSFDAASISSATAHTIGVARPTTNLPPIQVFNVPLLIQHLVNIISPWLIGCYTVGLVFMLARFSFGIVQLSRLRTTGKLTATSALNELFQKQQQRIQLRKSVKLFISTRAQVPMVIGFLKPVILLPAAALTHLDVQQLESILLHELAHIKRHDYLVNILQTIAETILFFNPFVWLLSAIARRERELCCDDLVVNNIKEPLPYASALATLAARRSSIMPQLAMAAIGQPTDLYRRIKRIMEMKENPIGYSQLAATIIIVATIASSIAVAQTSIYGTRTLKATYASVQQKNTLKQIAKADAIAPKSNKQGNPIVDEQPSQTPATTEENILLDRLLQARVVDQVSGFVVEKQLDRLYINGVLQSPEVSAKFLYQLKKEKIRIEVFSMTERMRMHPDAGFIQLLLPATFSSPCVDKRPVKKDDC